MSNPVTNLEIEDVLSSIRRLVAEGDKLRSAAAKLVPPVQTAPSPDPWPPREDIPEAAETEEPPVIQAGKFVLTPAFRVAEPPPAPVAEPEAAEGEARVTLPFQQGAPEPEVPVAAAPPEVDRVPRAWDLSLADALILTDAEPVILPERADDEAADMVSDFASDFAADLDPELGPDLSSDLAPEVATLAEGRSRLEATIAELEAAITARSDEWEPDGSEVPPVMDWAATAAEPAFLSSRQIIRSAVVEEVEAIADSVPLTEATWEAVVEGELPDDFLDEDEDDLSDDLERSAPRARGGLSDEGPSAYLSEDQILDEEALRTLVMEIVRQELQGTLGERITRNVRKLVRREIYRVLSSQEFD